LGRVQDAAERMARLIENLLRYARLGTKATEFETFPLDEALDEAILDVEARLESSGGTIERARLPRVLGDRSQLEQVFANLLSNALKFRKPETPPRVAVTVADAGAAWEVRVADNGIGFDAAAVGRLFEPFSRLHARGRY